MNAADEPDCQLIGCKERCGKVMVELVDREGAWAIFCPRGRLRTMNHPKAGDDTIEPTTPQQFEVFLRFSLSRATVKAALYRAAGDCDGLE